MDIIKGRTLGKVKTGCHLDTTRQNGRVPRIMVSYEVERWTTLVVRLNMCKESHCPELASPTYLASVRPPISPFEAYLESVCTEH